MKRGVMKKEVGRWGILEVYVDLKCLQSPLIEIAGAGGYLQGDRGDLMTPGFPEQNYPNGALYQVRDTILSNQM